MQDIGSSIKLKLLWEEGELNYTLLNKIDSI